MFARYAGFSAEVYLLCVGTVVNRVGALLVPFLAIYLQDALGFAPADSARALAAYGLGGAVANQVGGQLADRYGRRPVMVASLLGSGACMALLSQLREPAHVIGAIFILACVADMYRPATSAMIADVVAPERRMHAFALMYTAVNVGSAVAPLIAAALVKVDWTWLFVGDGLTSAVFGLMVLTMVRETRNRRGDVTEARVTPWGEAVRHMLGDRPFVIFWMAMTMTGVVFMQHLAALPTAMTEDGLGADAYARLLAMNALVVATCQLWFSNAVSRFRPAYVMAAAGAVTGWSFAGHALVNGEWAHLAVGFAWTVGEMLNASYGQAIASVLAPPALRARYMGAYGLTWSAAMVGGSLLGGELMQRGGTSLALGACAGVGTLAMVLHLRIATVADAARPA